MNNNTETSGILENPNPPRTTSFKCPICEVPLMALNGTKLNLKDGVTVFCNNVHGNLPGQCTAQEVFGHGRNEKDAYDIVTQKYKKSA
jgi:hypothetical protein